MSLYAAIDLHSTNSVLAVLDDSGAIRFRRRFPNQLAEIVGALEAFRNDVRGVVESTYNGYWRVDGLEDAGYRVHLANTAALPQYDGLKHGNDDTDAAHLANLLRLGILPEGFIYPRAERGLRDLLRRRMLLVQQSVRLMHSVQSLWARTSGQTLSANAFRALDGPGTLERWRDPAVQMIALTEQAAWHALREQIDAIERYVSTAVPDRAGLARLRTTHQRKTAKTHPIIATKATAHKIARGCYYVLPDEVNFDVARAFG